MDKPYFAILFRFSKDFYSMSDVEKIDMTDEERERLVPKIVNLSTDYNSLHMEFKDILNSFNNGEAAENYKEIYGEELPEDVPYEICIVRISPMTDWKK